MASKGIDKGNWWSNKFAYMLDFDNEGKITWCQAWTDSVTANLACKGKLNSLREVKSPKLTWKIFARYEQEFEKGQPT